MSFHQAAASLSGSGRRSPSPRAAGQQGTSQLRDYVSPSDRHMLQRANSENAVASSFVSPSASASVLASTTPWFSSPFASPQAGFALTHAATTPATFFSPSAATSTLKYVPVETPLRKNSQHAEPSVYSPTSEAILVKDLCKEEEEVKKSKVVVDNLESALQAKTTLATGLRSQLSRQQGQVEGFEQDIYTLQAKKEANVEQILALLQENEMCDSTVEQRRKQIGWIVEAMKKVDGERTEVDNSIKEHVPRLKAAQKDLNRKQDDVESSKSMLHQFCPAWELRDGRQLTQSLKTMESFESVHALLGFDSVTGFWDALARNSTKVSHMETLFNQYLALVIGPKVDATVRVLHPLIESIEGRTRWVHTEFPSHWRFNPLYGRMMKQVFVEAELGEANPQTVLFTKLVFRPAGQEFMSIFCTTIDVEKFNASRSNDHSLERRVMRLSLWLGLAIDTVLTHETRDGDIPETLEIPEVLKTPGYGFD